MSDATDFQTGDLLCGRYRLQRRLGAGAMGVVWSARNEATDRDFALKLMLPCSTSHASRFQRFVQEAKACGRLRHRNVVEVYDLGRVEASIERPDDPRAGQPYLVMELLEGESLEDFCDRLGPLPVGTALRILGDVAAGLEAAHRAGVLHRDLKPANVFLHRNSDGSTTPKILDFGVSKLTRPTSDEVITAANMIVGSPAYMSPEQTMGVGEVDARSDVWSLGVMLYFVLSGRLPFDAIAHRELLMQIVTTRPPPIETLVRELPDDVAKIVARCLEPEKAHRYASSQALSEACREAIASNDLPR
ncbi:MAG: serine/threonine-protein kinase, partial [Polyangiales bacterium]